MSQDSEEQFHRKMAVDLFNRVWSLIEKPGRSQEEEDEMVHAAHASRYHWGQIGQPVNLARGEWQISRVYAILNRPPSALYHAGRCLEICRANGIADFDIAFAHEAMARASAAMGDRRAFAEHLQQAHACGDRIQDADDRKLFFSDLESEPWFGMR
jgi:hypothetical protein